MSDKNAINIQTLMSLSPGDLIEFPRGSFSHWGIYLGGDDDVAHFTTEDEDEKVQMTNLFAASGVMLFGTGKVCIENFWKVVDKGTAKKNNSDDFKYRPLPPHAIVANAKKMLGKREYNIIKFNCEHFAKRCRYGLEMSDQVQEVVEGFAAVATAGIVVGSLLYGMFKGDKKNNQ